MTKKNLEKFLEDLLKKCDLEKSTISFLMKKESLEIFDQAFTHKSYDSKFNYEKLEFFGDQILNSCVSQYITKRFPKIVSGKWVTRLNHNLHGEMYMKIISENFGFVDQLKYKRPGYFDEGFVPIKIKVDIIESFIGAVVQIIDKKYKKGVGYTIAYRMIEKMYNTLYISLKPTYVFDKATKIKELIDMLGFRVKSVTKKKPIKLKDGSYFFSWILTDKTIFKGGKTGKEIKVFESFTEKKYEAKNNVILQAEEYLNESGLTIDFFDQRFLPYQIDKKTISEDIETEHKEIPEIPGHFSKYFSSLLSLGGLKKKYVKKLSQDNIFLAEAYLSCIDTEYSPTKEGIKFSAQGVTVLDLAVSDYITENFGDFNQQKFSETKQAIIKHKQLEKLVKCLYLKDFIVLENEENSQKILRSIFGAIFMLCGEKYGYNISYNIIHTIVRKYLNLSGMGDMLHQDADEIIKPKINKLRKIIKQKKLEFNKCVKTERNPKTGIFKTTIEIPFKGKIFTTYFESGNSKDSIEGAAKKLLEKLKMSF